MPHSPAGPPNFYAGSYDPIQPGDEEDWETYGVGDALSGVYTCPECRGNPRRTDPNRAPCAHCNGQGIVYASSAGAAVSDHAARAPARHSTPSGGSGGSSASSRRASGGSKRSSGGKPRPASFSKR